MTYKIDQNNYEAFALDYLEGTLKPQALQAFERFLDAHPVIRDELELFSDMHLDGDDIRCPFKTNLRKAGSYVPDRMGSNDIECIAYVEGDLNPDRNKEMEERMRKDQSIYRQVHIFKHLQLLPGSEYMEDSARLKKSRREIPFYFGLSYAVAALFLVVLISQIIIHFLFPPSLPDISYDVPSQVPELPVSTRPRFRDMPILITEAPATRFIPNTITETAVSNDNFPVAYNPEDSQITEPESLTGLIQNIVPRSGTISPARPIVTTLCTPYLYISGYLSERDLNTLASYSIEEFKIKLLWETENEKPNPHAILSIVQTGINGINKITGWNMQLHSSYNEQGRVQSFSFLSDELKITSKIQND